MHDEYDASGRCDRVDHHPHKHRFGGTHKENEHRTLIVVILTLITMVAEIVFGILTGSMALLADGWHMGTHAGALSIALFAYIYSRKNADMSRYTFGTGKIAILAAFTNAIILGLAGILIFYESLMRLLAPVNISFDVAILIAVIGLLVNVTCAWVLRGGEGHRHGSGHSHSHEHETDHNYHAAFLHVIADALTSALAIGALFIGKYAGLVCLDSMAGFLGAFMILWWAYGLIRQTGRILLDGDVEPEKTEAVRQAVESDSNSRVMDLHVWRLSENDLAVIVSLVTSVPQSPEHYHALLGKFDDIKHISIEVHNIKDNLKPCQDTIIRQ